MATKLRLLKKANVAMAVASNRPRAEATINSTSVNAACPPALIDILLHSILSDESGHLPGADELAGRPGQLNLNHPQITQIRFPSGRRADHLHAPGVIEIVRRWIGRIVCIKRRLEGRRNVTRKIDHLIPVEQTDHLHPFLKNLDRPDAFAREANLVE